MNLEISVALTNPYHPSSREVLQIHNSSGIFDPGPPNPKMVGCISIVYFMLYISLFKGVKSSGEMITTIPRALV